MPQPLCGSSGTGAPELVDGTLKPLGLLLVSQKVASHFGYLLRRQRLSLRLSRHRCQVADGIVLMLSV